MYENLLSDAEEARVPFLVGGEYGYEAVAYAEAVRDATSRGDELVLGGPGQAGQRQRER